MRRTQILIVVAVSLAFASGYLWGRRAPRSTDLARECTLAAGRARAALDWLAPGHPRRDAGLMLITRDAAWASVCARDRAAAARLQVEIDAVAGSLGDRDARPLGLRLVEILERR